MRETTSEPAGNSASIAASTPERTLVSVVIPTRNSAPTLGACLRSIARQTYDDVEAVVVDNFSLDATREVASEHDCAVLTAGPERSAQRNHGARHARGSHLLFVDSDMVLEPTVVEECVAAARSGATAVIIPEVSFGEGFWARCKRLERSCYLGDDDIEAARFFTRDLFYGLGGFDEELNAGEDWDLNARAKSSGAAMARTASLIHHDEGRLELGHLLAKKFHYGRSLVAYRRKHRALAARQLLPTRPAFFRHRRALAAQPILLGGIVLMKSLELGAAALGAASTLVMRRRSGPVASGADRA
jgi:glycosyltransferase involved in cell wall biosynthesis